MDKKILNLIICVLICLAVILGLLVVKFATVKVDVKTTEDTEKVIEETVVNDPVEGNLKIHKSQNGYSVKYPADMQAKQIARSIDFILEDAESGSSLNVVTAKNDGTLKKMNREEFEYSLLHTTEDAVLLSYEDILLNGTEAVKAVFTYMDSVTEQYIVITDGLSYNISVTKGENITEEMSLILDSVVKSFTLN